MSAAAGRRRALALLIAVSVVVGTAAWARRGRLVVATGFAVANDPLAALDRQITDEFGLTKPVAFVVVPDGGVWTHAGLAKVLALTRDVLTLPGVIATDVVSLASPNMRELRLTDDGLEPVYLMAEVPADAAAIAALRKRVDDDPNYGGNLVSRDGTAALVVANFLPGTPDPTIAAAVLAARARHADGATRIEVTGAPVVLATVQGAIAPTLDRFALAAALGCATLLLVAGLRATAGAAAAAALATLWALALLVAWGSVLLPWSAYGLATGALLAALVATAAPPPSPRRALALLAPPAAAGLVLALLVDGPARALGIAIVAGAVAAVPAGVVVATLARRPALPARRAEADARSGMRRIACLAALALAWLGTLGLHASFGTAGYGERYLPAGARAGLDAMRRHFPPPTTFVVRMRGAPGFVAEPAVLEAMDAVVGAMRDVPGVRSAQSLADVVKLVNRSFNDDAPGSFEIPADRGLVARYLALAYSPGFRRFVDRGLGQTALWVYADGDDPVTLERVHARLEAALEAHPPPGATVDPIAGDGALALAMAHTGRRLASTLAIATGVLVAVAALTAAAPLGATLDAVAGALGPLLVGAGIAGWLGLALDLVLIPILACVTVLGATVALLARASAPWRELYAVGAALAVAALPLALAPLGAARVLVPLLVAPLAALASCEAARRR